MTEVNLSALLSQTLVAFTIEFDNESEHRNAHRTTVKGRVRTADGREVGGGADATPHRGPWLVSQVMWENVMRHVGADGVTVQELHARARTRRDSLGGLQRWGYVVVTPASSDARRARTAPPKAGDLVRPTAAGRNAQAVWRPLAAEVEVRWRTRFGEKRIEVLRRALQAVVDQFAVDLPLYLPIVYPTNNGRADVPEPRGAGDSGGSGVSGGARLDLSALLSQTLLAFTIDFERQSRISLPISANTLRVLDDQGVRVRDLPVLTGVSKEANAMVVGFLQRHGCVVVESDPAASRGKIIRLTSKGQNGQDKYLRLLAATEEHWGHRFGRSVITDLRGALVQVAGEVDEARRSPLFEGLTPYPDGWRASVRPPETLPHYPMVLHRGGYPDGS